MRTGKPASSLLRRTLTAAVLLPIVLGVLIWVPWGWVLIVAAAAASAVGELDDMARARGGHPPRHLAGALAGLVVVASAAHHVVPAMTGGRVTLGSAVTEPAILRLLTPDSSPTPSWLAEPGVSGDFMVFALILVPILAFLTQLGRDPDDRAASDWATTVAGPAYVGLLASFAAGLRYMPGGVGWTLAFLLLVWSNDTAAYLAGRRFGRRPLAPALSPKKTIEGAVAGSAMSIVLGGLATILAGMAAGPWPDAFGPLSDLSVAAGLLLGLLVALLAPLGDLSKSFLKRESGVKDAGDVLPGHGGVLDRIDSLLFAAPAVYVVAWLALTW